MLEGNIKYTHEFKRTEIYRYLRNYCIEKGWDAYKNEFQITIRCLIPETFVEGIESVGMIEYFYRISVEENYILVEFKVPSYIQTDWSTKRVLDFIEKHIKTAIAINN